MLLLKILFLSSLLCWPNEIHANPPPSLTIYALRYGSNSKYASNHVFAHYLYGTDTAFAWFFYLIKTPHQLILIDTGFNNNEEYRQKFGIGRLYNINLLFREAGISPNSITDIILTHGHVDHAGNIGLFPHAHFYIQKDEYELIQRTPFLDKQLALIPPKNITLFKNQCSPLPNMKIKRVGGHTKGSCIIELTGKHQRFLFTGDNCYLVSNCRDQKYVGDVTNRLENKRFIDTYHDYPGMILTHHDPNILAQAKQISKNVFLIYTE
jgi:glyoxylase-like metal-dependent hydrolase (beta-lactamase superfamily II)